MPKAIISGGGIGGLTAALCLIQKGWDVQVLEQASALTDIGAGIQISPNGMNVLRQLGLEEQILQAGFLPKSNELRIGKTGAQVFQIPVKEIAPKRWGAAYVQIHRADLLRILADRLEEQRAGSLRTNAKIISYQQDDKSVTAQFATGEEIAGDILIGADGIHSQIKAQILGRDAPRFTGNVAWRMTVPREKLEPLLPPETGCVWVGAKRHAVTYYLRQGKLVNLVGIVERDDWQEEGWTIEGKKEDALADFENYHPIILNIIAQAEQHHLWALYDRAPLEKWVEGRVALLGDACHPMLPFLAQGAVMAMEDAWILGEMLGEVLGAQNTDIVQALKSYQSLRFHRTAKVQAAARANMHLFHRRTKLSQFTTYGAMKLAATLSPALIHKRMDWLYGHDVTR